MIAGVLGGVAHLLNFEGSDTLSACYYAQVLPMPGRDAPCLAPHPAFTASLCELMLVTASMHSHARHGSYNPVHRGAPSIVCASQYAGALSLVSCSRCWMCTGHFAMFVALQMLASRPPDGTSEL